MVTGTRTAVFPLPVAPAWQASRLSATLARQDVQDGVFAAVIVGSRIPVNFGMPGALTCLMMTALWAALRREQVVLVASRCWIQLACPLVALLSVTWAVHPDVTLRAAVQMSLTALAGLLLSQSTRPRAVLVSLFVVYSGYTVASFLTGNTRPVGIHGEMALYGLAGEAKNFFADTAGTATLLALAVLAASLEKRTFVLAAVLGGITAICGAATLLANSAGSVAATALAASLLVGLLVLRRRARGLKFAFAVAIVSGLAIAGLFFEQLLAIVQELSDKDAGLTGRGYLWYRAAFVMADRPWLGVGYFGFWTPQNPDAVGLWHHFDVRQESTGFSFHNAYIETRIETGYLGLVALLSTWAVGCLLLLRRFVLTQSLPTCLWLAYLTLQLAKTPVEPIRPVALAAPTIMLFIALGFSCFPVMKAKPDPGPLLR